MSAWEREGLSDDWYTPKYIFDALSEYFWMDVAAPKEGPRYVPCDSWLWQNSLESSWLDFVWMNPPFGGRDSEAKLKWMRKFFDHGNGVALTPDRTSAQWFQYSGARADAILFVAPKIKFERPDGSIGDRPSNGTALFAAGQRAVQALMNARSLGLLVRCL
jgi:DNA N-6-adenine-methyltransferase Dam